MKKLMILIAALGMATLAVQAQPLKDTVTNIQAETPPADSTDENTTEVAPEGK